MSRLLAVQIPHATVVPPPEHSEPDDDLRRWSRTARWAGMVAVRSSRVQPVAFGAFFLWIATLGLWTISPIETSGLLAWVITAIAVTQAWMVTLTVHAARFVQRRSMRKVPGRTCPMFIEIPDRDRMIAVPMREVITRAERVVTRRPDLGPMMHEILWTLSETPPPERWAELPSRNGHATYDDRVLAAWDIFTSFESAA